jgi:hypothetical protein
MFKIDNFINNQCLMDIKTNQKLIIILCVVGIVAVIGGVLLLRKGEKSEDTTSEKTQQTLEEMQGQESETSVDGRISEGESIDITFRFRDYKDAPENPETLQETKDALIPVEGNATFKLIEIGRTDKTDNFHQAGEGKELYYVVYEYIGDENNPDSLTIHPRSISETGWDPAPQFVILDGNDEDYSSSSYSRSLLESLGYDASLSGPDLNETEVWANVWEIEEGLNPEIVLKYIDMDGGVHYVEVK